LEAKAVAAQAVAEDVHVQDERCRADVLAAMMFGRHKVRWEDWEVDSPSEEEEAEDVPDDALSADEEEARDEVVIVKAQEVTEEEQEPQHNKEQREQREQSEQRDPQDMDPMELWCPDPMDPDEEEEKETRRCGVANVRGEPCGRVYGTCPYHGHLTSTGLAGYEALASPVDTSIFECENGCGFESYDVKVVEEHEHTCLFDASMVQMYGQAEEHDQEAIFECEQGCGFESTDMILVEEHEQACEVGEDEEEEPAYKRKARKRHARAKKNSKLRSKEAKLEASMIANMHKESADEPGLERSDHCLSGFKGISKCQGKWEAKLGVTYLGLFDTPVLAARVRRDYIAQLRKENAGAPIPGVDDMAESGNDREYEEDSM